MTPSSGTRRGGGQAPCALNALAAVDARASGCNAAADETRRLERQAYLAGYVAAIRYVANRWWWKRLFSSDRPEQISRCCYAFADTPIRARQRRKWAQARQLRKEKILL